MLRENIVGYADNPILITNCGGQATTISTGSYGWKFQNSEYVKISGDGSPDYEYSIKVSTLTGFYLGRVESSCKIGDEEDWVTTYSHSIKRLRVFNNLLENIGYDGFQVKNADENAENYNNVVRNYGTVDAFTNEVHVLLI